MYELIPIEYMTFEIERGRANHRFPHVRMTHEPIAPVALPTHWRTLKIAIVVMIALSLATLMSAFA
jgi:hypothetical protein